MGAIFRKVVYPAYHWVKRDGVNKALRELEHNQWLSTDELLSLQQSKLTDLLSFAGRNVPYYRKILQDSGISVGKPVRAEDLAVLPILTKSVIHQQGDSLVSESLEGNALYSNSTSGSTGEALRFFTDARSMAYRKAGLIRSDSWTGWRLGDRSVSLWGAAIDQKRAAGLRGKLHGLMTSHRFFSSFDLSPERMDEYIKVIQKFKPVMFLAYPGPMERFAIHCQERGIKFSSLKGIVSSAEMLWPQQREIIEDVFGVRIFNRYATREVAHIASECEVHDGLHISVDRLLVEVVDEQGRLCEPGQVGRILVTDLDNFGMPMIRYEIGDRGVPSEHKSCVCGRGLPLLSKIEGRTLDVIRAPDGRRIGGTFWTLLLRSRRGFRQFQVVQESLDGVVINYVPDVVSDEGAFDYYTAKIREYCGQDFGVEFRKQDSIALTVSGKQRVIVSLLKD